MSEVIKLNSKKISQSVDNKAIAIEYKKAKDTKNDLFVELLKKIINENKRKFDNSSKSNNLNKEGTIECIILQHGRTMPQILAPNSSVTKLKDVYEGKFEYWINGGHKSSIPYNRSKYIDFLLYFNYAEYQGSYKYNRKKIDAALAKFGYSPLYLMNYQEFCVISALKLAKDGEDIYTVFGSLYNNSDFREMIETPDTEHGVEDFEKFTNQIEFDFDKVTRLGSKADIDVPANGKNEMSLYKFVDLYRYAFGRARLSSLRLLCTLILGEKIDDKLFNDRWNESSIESTEISVKKELYSNRKTLKKVFAKLCKSTCEDFLKNYKKNLINRRVYDYNEEMRYKKSMQSNQEITIFDLDIAVDDCREFLKLKGVKGFSDGWNSSTSNPKTLSYVDKKNFHNECEKFFFAKIKEGDGLKNQNEWIDPDRKDADIIVWDSYFYRDESVTRESMVWAMILCLRSDVLKGSIAGRIGAEDAKSVSNKILRRINKILESVGMLPLNAAWGKQDYLLINAVRHTDYKKLYYADTIYFPYRNYVFEEIFANMTTNQKLEEIDKIENELLAY